MIPPKTLALLGLLWTLVACREQVFEPIRDGLVMGASLSGEVNVLTRADLLFVVDDSRSMRNEQEKLAQGFATLAARLDELDPPVDWQVGVITTTVDEGFGPCEDADPSAPAQCSATYGGSGFVCESGRCVRRFPERSGRLVASDDNPAVLRRSGRSREEIVRLFGEKLSALSEGARQEQPLRAIRLAVESGLEGFRREEARLVIVVASDEDDCSDSTERIWALEKNDEGLIDRCVEAAESGEGLDSVSEWVGWLKQTGEVAMGVIVGLDAQTERPGLCVDEACAAACDSVERASCQAQCVGALQPARCEEECVLECEIFCGAQTPGRRLAEAAVALSGSVASVCESEYGPALGQLARVMGIPDRLLLPSRPLDLRGFFFEVSRAGKRITCEEGRDWRLEEKDGRFFLLIEQAGRCRLLPDDRWSIRYLAEEEGEG